MTGLLSFFRRIAFLTAIDTFKQKFKKIRDANWKSRREPFKFSLKKKWTNILVYDKLVQNVLWSPILLEVDNWLNGKIDGEFHEQLSGRNKIWHVKEESSGITTADRYAQSKKTADLMGRIPQKSNIKLDSWDRVSWEVNKQNGCRMTMNMLLTNFT